jgi:hypothetical protein
LWRTVGKPTGDDLFNAHMSGIEVGIKEHERIIQGQHLNFRRMAIKTTENIYERLKQVFKIQPVGMKMRVEGLSSFGTLFLLASDDFYSEEKIEEIYRFLHNEQKKISSINWSFVLMPAGKELNESAMISDGYILSYAEPT